MMVTHGFASFNRGLRAYFFGLAALAWFIQPWAFVLATSWVGDPRINIQDDRGKAKAYQVRHCNRQTGRAAQ